MGFLLGRASSSATWRVRTFTSLSSSAMRMQALLGTTSNMELIHHTIRPSVLRSAPLAVHAPPRSAAHPMCGTRAGTVRPQLACHRQGAASRLSVFTRRLRGGVYGREVGLATATSCPCSPGTVPSIRSRWRIPCSTRAFGCLLNSSPNCARYVRTRCSSTPPPRIHTWLSLLCRLTPMYSIAHSPSFGGQVRVAAR